MRLAIVGNGPTAAGKGEEIDALDFVVRTTTFPAVFTEGEAGRKLDAWAWYGHTKILSFDGEGHDILRGVTPPGVYEAWQTLPPSRCHPPHQGHVGNFINMFTAAGQRIIRAVTEIEYGQQASWVVIHSQRYGWCGPSTGFTAVDMAIRRMQPAELHLFGFDATLPDRPGWGDFKPTDLAWMPDGNGHDHLAEKRALVNLRDRGLWMGSPCPVKLIWHHGPELPQ